MVKTKRNLDFASELAWRTGFKEGATSALDHLRTLLDRGFSTVDAIEVLCGSWTRKLATWARGDDLLDENENSAPTNPPSP